jgi:hypothetical protein
MAHSRCPLQAESDAGQAIPGATAAGGHAQEWRRAVALRLVLGWCKFPNLNQEV